MFIFAAQLWGAQEVIGVDIDDTLIRAAWKRRRSLWSQQQPSVSETIENQGTSKKRMLDEEGPHSAPVHDYFPAAFEHMFGPLSMSSTSSGSTSRNQFPHNVSFRTTDWVNDGAVEDHQGYDVVIAFSITKWIHLNNGDEGIRSFFHRIFGVLRPGGVFILEPQDWASYAKTRRMNSVLRENAKTLQLRPDDFSRILLEIGFVEEEKLGAIGEGGFCRPIVLFYKPTAM